MPTTEATFDYAAAINWDKNGVTATAAAMLRLLGYSPETMFRPRYLEDPKFALSLLCVWIGIVVLVGWLILGMGRVVMVITRRRVPLGA